MGSPVITGSANTNIICEGESVILTGSGAISYEWYDGTNLISNNASFTVNPVTTKTYKMIGKNGSSCKDSTNITITVSPKPSILITPSSGKIAAGQFVTLIANGALTYSWSPSTGLSSTTGASVIASPPVTTTYTVTGIDAKSCSNTQTVTVTLAATGISKNASNGKIIFQPNPATNEVSINIPQKGNVKLYDITGKIVLQKELNIGVTILSVGYLPRGIYTAEIISGDAKNYSKLILR